MSVLAITESRAAGRHILNAGHLWRHHCEAACLLGFVRDDGMTMLISDVPAQDQRSFAARHGVLVGLVRLHRVHALGLDLWAFRSR